jgi:hypothetical protein
MEKSKYSKLGHYLSGVGHGGMKCIMGCCQQPKKKMHKDLRRLRKQEAQKELSSELADA